MSNNLTNNKEEFDEFFYDIKSISSLPSNWCLSEGEADDETLFLAISLQNIVKDFEKSRS